MLVKSRGEWRRRSKMKRRRRSRLQSLKNIRLRQVGTKADLTCSPDHLGCNISLGHVHAARCIPLSQHPVPVLLSNPE